MKNTVAICYDFDGTLSPTNMQESSFIPEHLKGDKDKFWAKVKDNAKNNDMDEILSYMDLIIREAKTKEKECKKTTFKENGKNIIFFNGVEDWFDRINTYAKTKNLAVEHYVISSGLKPMIEGCSIGNKFKKIFACDFKYDGNGAADFPSVVINYTTKTQYLFRINKKVLNNWDHDKLNQFTPEDERPIPFNRMIYIGDGLTDVPAMKMINYKNGYSIGVYNPNKRTTKTKKSPRKICKEMLEHKRCTFVAPADYSEEKELDKIVKLIIDKIASEVELKKILDKEINNKNSIKSVKKVFASLQI